MGKAMYCTRCGKLVNTDEIDVTTGSLVGFWNEDMVVDLCEYCKNKLDDWVHGEDLEETEEDVAEDKP